MKRKSGKFIPKKVGGENYNAYIPYKLPPQPSIDLEGTVSSVYLSIVL